MNIEFLAIANVLLLTRLVTLLKDDTPSGTDWANKAAVEAAVAFAFYRLTASSLILIAGVIGLNFVGWWLDRRRRHKNSARLAVGLATLLVVSVIASPGVGLHFRPSWSSLGAALERWSALAAVAEAFASARVQLVLLGLLFAANETNLIIRAVFDWLNLKPQARTGVAGAVEVDVGEYNRGRVIGLLERALLYFFVLQGQYGAIGFVLAAKAFTRFKALDDRPFAEYVLIGTLLSACLALGVGTAVKALLG
jgi:hypothetical protein